jgi:glycine hydroxymethyltransferase
MNLLEEKLAQFDPEVDGIIRDEMQRNEETINLIASENYPPKSLMKAISSMLSGIYSEGYPGERWYRGLENIDRLESLASHGAKANLTSKMFDIVQYGVDPQTGLLDYETIRKQALETQPKLIVCGASAYPRIIDFARFGQIAREAGAFLMADISHIAGMVVTGDHPSPVPHCDIVTTTTHKTLRMTRGALILCKAEHADKVDRAVFPMLQGGPHQANISAIAVGMKHLRTPEYRQYIREVLQNSTALSERLIEQGAEIVTGGTDNHLLLMDLAKWNIDGETASVLLEEAHLVVNKNKIPGDRGTAKKPSGIRLGTPAMTSRGMGPDEVRLIARWVVEVVTHPQDQTLRNRVKEEVAALCRRFPIYKMTY